MEEHEKDLQRFSEMIRGCESLLRGWKTAVIALIVGWSLTVGGFLWYISLWDYSETYTYEADGVYSMIDSEGNIIAQDISPEALEAAKEAIANDGES